MNLTRAQLISKLALAGVPVGQIAMFAPDEIGANLLGTTSGAFVRKAWDGFINLLELDPEANLTMPREIGGGKRISVPRYVVPGFVCRHAAFAFFGFLLLCFGKENAARAQQNDGYAVSVVYYTAEPRAADLNRSGRHARIFFVNDAGDLEQFEEGDGDPEPMTPTELASITFVAFV